MSKEERLRFKIWMILLGALFLIFLYAGNSLLQWTQDSEKNLPEDPQAPSVQVLHNVWIIDAGEDQLHLFYENEEKSFSYGQMNTSGENQDSLFVPPASCREQIADVTLTDGLVTDIRLKTDRRHGVILGADETYIEVEGYGKLPLQKQYQGYRIYQALSSVTPQELAFGYDLADFVLEDGEVCAILVAREAAMETIRVLLKTSGYESLLHDELILTGDTDFTIQYGAYGEEQSKVFQAGESLTMDADSDYFVEDRVVIYPNALSGKLFLQNVERAQETPGYRGHLELIKEGEKLAVVNELTLEEYLYAVVPSEMPSGYPDSALEAQAICARTYAYGHMQHAAYPQYGAHVDDSTSYQVYNNTEEQKSTTRAVKSTYGKVLYAPDGRLAETYYYSTSCGMGSSARVWKTEAAQHLEYLAAASINSGERNTSQAEELKGEEEFKAFITSLGENDFEKEEGWYRWSYTISDLSATRLKEALKARYQVNPALVQTYYKGEFVSREIQKFTEIEDLFISKREAGGVADELIIRTNKGTYKVISEYNIRAVLCDGTTKVIRQSGDEVSMPTLLPSAFFVIDTGNEDGNVVGYTLTGGGFGHGVGMSQNGAKNMALAGYTCDTILQYFYQDCTLMTIY